MSESAFLRFITENSILYCVFTLTERKPILSPFKDLKFKLFIKYNSSSRFNALNLSIVWIYFVIIFG